MKIKLAALATCNKHNGQNVMHNNRTQFCRTQTRPTLRVNSQMRPIELLFIYGLALAHSNVIIVMCRNKVIMFCHFAPFQRSQPITRILLHANRDDFLLRLVNLDTFQRRQLDLTKCQIRWR